MAISEKDVEHVALLARLYLDKNEIELLTLQLGQILEHAGKIAEIDTSAVEPTAHAFPLRNVFRDDKVLPCISKEDALSNAPDEEAGAFKVPKIV